jgi:recombination protein RecT
MAEQKQETAVERRNREKTDVQKAQAKQAWEMLNSMKSSIAAVLPKHLTPERMAMIAFTAMRRTPKLMECTRESLIGSIMTAAMLGLEPSGPLGHGALIPYNDRRRGVVECQFQPMYGGLLELARRSGIIRDVQLRAVYKGDKYSYRFGLDPEIVHIPLEGEGADDPNREPIAVYCIIRFNNGGVQWDQMSYAQGIAHGKRYSPSFDDRTGKFKEGSVWDENPLAMVLKTILKMVLKLCPKSPEMAAALQADDGMEAGRTVKMTKQGDDFFDVDFGGAPEEDGDGDKKNETERGTVNLADVKPAKEDNRGHGEEGLDAIRRKEQEVEAAAAAAKVKPTQEATATAETGTPKPAEQVQPAQAGGEEPNIPEPENPNLPLTEEQFQTLERMSAHHKVDQAAVVDFVKGVLKYPLLSKIKQKDYRRLYLFIFRGGRDVQQ